MRKWYLEAEFQDEILAGVILGRSIFPKSNKKLKYPGKFIINYGGINFLNDSVILIIWYKNDTLRIL